MDYELNSLARGGECARRGVDLRFLLSCTRLSWMLPRLPAPPLSSCSPLGPDRDSRLHAAVRHS